MTQNSKQYIYYEWTSYIFIHVNVHKSKSLFFFQLLYKSSLKTKKLHYIRQNVSEREKQTLYNVWQLNKLTNRVWAVIAMKTVTILSY